MASKAQVKEIIKCGKDPNYFLEQYIKIQHPVRGLIPFKMYDFQKSCITDFIDNRFNIVLKSRQQGLSTLSAAYAVWMALFKKEKNILIIATKLKVAQNFIIKVKSMIRSLPKWLVLPTIVSNNKQEIIFDHGSQIKAIPTSEDAGRSEALSLLIVDEAAFVRNFDTIWTGIYPTLSTGGRAIILSTPNGVGGQYHKLYTDADAGLNEFNAIKIPWNLNPEYDEEWFENITANMSKKQIAQEYLCNFALSGESFLDDKTIEWLSQLVLKPLVREGNDMNVWIWKQPLSEHDYIISADVARGDSKDYSTFHVIDVNESEVVAEYKGKIRPDLFGNLLCEYGKKYNNALLCPENNSYGFATILKINENGYPRLYYRKNKGVYVGGYIPPQTVETAGFNTNGKSKPTILAKLEEVLRNKTLLIYSSRFYEELKVFSIGANGKSGAKRGYNDDLVMSLAIGTWLFDASADHSKSSKVLNEEMLKAMSFKTKSYSETPDAIYSPVGVYSSFNKDSNRNQTNNFFPDVSKTKNQSKLLSDMSWVWK
jgi:hypothetical protein